MKNLKMRFGQSFSNSQLTTLNTMVKFDLNSNLKIFDSPNNKFKQISNFQMKSSFTDMVLMN